MSQWSTRRAEEPQILPLRYASVGMTSGGVAPSAVCRSCGRVVSNAEVGPKCRCGSLTALRFVLDDNSWGAHAKPHWRSRGSAANTMVLKVDMSDGREEREQQEYWREQEKKRDRDDRLERELPDQWRPERRES